VLVSNGGVDNKSTNAVGAYNYTGGTATVKLHGRYVKILDGCGSISLSNSSTGSEPAARSRVCSSTSSAMGSTATPGRTGRTTGERARRWGDAFALLETRDGCIGRGFIPGDDCHNCDDCDGLRDVSD
jgi:hypothetical protein